MSVVARNNVRVSGRGTRPLLFAHGFGCDQNMWRLVAPAFEDAYRVVLFDHVGAGSSDASALRPDQIRHARRLRHRRARDLPGAGPDGRDLRRALRQRDDRRPRGQARARAFQCARARRAVAALPQRRRLCRRLLAGRHRGAAGFARQQLSRLVERDGAGDHGQRRPARAGPGADQQLLPHRPGDCRPLRPRHVPVGQPQGPRGRDDSDADPAVLRRRDRTGRGRPITSISRCRAAGSCR